MCMFSKIQSLVENVEAGQYDDYFVQEDEKSIFLNNCAEYQTDYDLKLSIEETAEYTGADLNTNSFYVNTIVPRMNEAGVVIMNFLLSHYVSD